MINPTLKAHASRETPTSPNSEIKWLSGEYRSSSLPRYATAAISAPMTAVISPALAKIKKPLVEVKISISSCFPSR